VSFWKACADIRVWALALAYACCFGMEITFDGVACALLLRQFQV
jgi:NNP family nitrate/nitrite transporter-like MFS transporter